MSNAEKIKRPVLVTITLQPAIASTFGCSSLEFVKY